MKKRKFPIVLVLGIVLVLIGCVLAVVLLIRARIGADNTRAVVEQMNMLLPQRSVGTPDSYPHSQMPILEIDGVDYVAMIEIPSMNVNLPVADKWDGAKLFESPARFYGSAYRAPLVIGGTDDAHQFAFCSSIDNGTSVVVTDMLGAQFSYTVTRVDRSETAETLWLIGDADLTLYCQDVFSMEYIAVRCEFAYR